MDLTSRMAGAPSPRSTVCFSEKFANGQRTRSNASASAVSFLIVISSGRSIPIWSDAGTRAFVTCSASSAAAKSGVRPSPATSPSARNRDLPVSAAHPVRSRAPSRLRCRYYDHRLSPRPSEIFRRGTPKRPCRPNSSPPSSHTFSCYPQVASQIEAAVGPVKNDSTGDSLAYSMPIEILHASAALHAQMMTGERRVLTAAPASS